MLKFRPKACYKKIVRKVVLWVYLRKISILGKLPPIFGLSMISVGDMAVIIAAFNEAQNIEACIQSVIAAGIDPKHIYVIDDASTDNTAQLAEALGVNVLRNKKNRGKSGSIKAGVDYFQILNNPKIKYIGTLDADSIVCPGYFRAIKYRFMTDLSIAAVRGQLKSSPYRGLRSLSPLPLKRALNYRNLAKKLRWQDKRNVIATAPGSCTVFWAEIFAQLDFKDCINEDQRFTFQLRIMEPRWRIAYEARAIVFTQDPYTLSGYVRQSIRWFTGGWDAMHEYHVWNWKKKPAGLSFFKLMMVWNLCWNAVAIIYPFLIIWIWRGLPLHHWIGMVCSPTFYGGIWGLVFILSIFAAIADRRPAILVFFIFYPCIQWIENLIFLCTFIRTTVCGIQDTTWRFSRKDQKLPNYIEGEIA